MLIKTLAIDQHRTSSVDIHEPLHHNINDHDDGMGEFLNDWFEKVEYASLMNNFSQGSKPINSTIDVC